MTFTYQNKANVQNIEEKKNLRRNKGKLQISFKENSILYLFTSVRIVSYDTEDHRPSINKNKINKDAYGPISNAVQWTS